MPGSNEAITFPEGGTADPRSRHHPLNQRRAAAPKQLPHSNERHNGNSNGHPTLFSPGALQHHPSHPDHGNYVRHLQLQQRLNGTSPHTGFTQLPTSPTTAPPQYQAYNPSLGANANNTLHQTVRRVSSVERGLGSNKPPVSHRMSRMKSFGDRDRERHRGEEMGFPPRREQLQGQERNMLGFPSSSPRVFDGRERNGVHVHPPRVDSAGDKQMQINHGLPNGPQRGKAGMDLNIRKIGLPSSPSPSSSRPGSSRRESATGLRAVQTPDNIPMERSESRNGHNESTQNLPSAPGLRMPLAFNSIARERGFSASSASPQPPTYPLPLPSPRPSNSAPDLANAETNSRSHHGYGPNAYYAQRRREHYNQSQPPSAQQSPHTSMQPEDQRSASRTGHVVDRTSTVSSSAASSNAMTVDEAIGMYGSDSDADEADYEATARVEEEISKFHSENSGNEEITGPVSPYPLEFPLIPSPRLPSSPSVASPISPTQNNGELPFSPPTSEALAEDPIVPQVQEIQPQPDAAEESSPMPMPMPMPIPMQKSPPTPPQSPPAVHIPVNPLDNCMQPMIMPAYISNEVPPRLPFVNPPNLKDPVKDARDRYGFRKQTQYVSLEEYEAWSVGYEETLQRRRKKWEQLMKESGLVYGDEVPVRFPPPSAKIKRYIRKGIPPEWRGNAWFWYAGGQARMAKNPGLYQKLLQEHASSPDWEIIERDLHRTFPDNIFFKPDSQTYSNAPHQKKPSRLPETPIVQALRRVLVAYSIYVPKVGYCQSLNFLAGMLLLFMEEEKAFWMLYIITHQHLPGTHEVNLEGSTADQGVFMMSVRESLPAVWAKIAGGLDGNMDSNPRDLPPVTLCTTPWFMSGFIGTLPIESILRVWDSWFYEGSKTLFRIALTILKLGENQIKAVNDPMEVFQVVQNIPRKLSDAGALLEACFRRRNGFGHISQQDVDERRRERKNAYARERAKLASPGGAGVPGTGRKSKDDAGLRLDFSSSHENDFLRMGGRFTRKMKLKV